MSGQLLHAWQRTVRRHGTRRAVVQAADGAAATFAELDRRADAWLRAGAVDVATLAGRAVVFAVPNGLAWLDVFLGCVKAGAVATPLDAAEPPASRREIARNIRAGFVWEDGRLFALPGSKRFRDPEMGLIKLTSGSTGTPRALAFTGGQMLADGRQVTATMGIASGELNYALIPLGHSYGLGNLSIPLLAHGVPLVCGAAPLPHAIAADFERWKPTVFPGVPALWRALAAADIRLDSLRLAISAGAPLPPETAVEFEQRFNRRIHGFYGSSETGGIAYDRDGKGTLAGTVGTAMRGVKLTILPGQRLRVASASVLTSGRKSRKHAGSWFMSDRVECDAKGRLRLLGRRGTMVKIAGRRLDPAEIVALLKRLPGVTDAWVGTSPGPEPFLGAAVVTTRPTAEIRADLLSATAAWKVPRRWIALPALPLTDRGKTDRRALEAQVFEQKPTGTG